MPKEHVKVVLTSLLEEVKQVMPPLNWAGVLSPFMRLDFGNYWIIFVYIFLNIIFIKGSILKRRMQSC